jgi:hypothetical protein
MSRSCSIFVVVLAFTGCVIVPLPTKELVDVLSDRNQAYTDTSYLLPRAEDEQIGQGTKPDRQEVKNRYESIAEKFNSSMDLIKNSVDLGNSPKDYAKEMQLDFSEVHLKVMALRAYRAKFDEQANRFKPAIAEEALGTVIVQGVVSIWEAYKKAQLKERERVKTQLEGYKMPNFETFSKNLKR